MNIDPYLRGLSFKPVGSDTTITAPEAALEDEEESDSDLDYDVTYGGSTLGQPDDEENMVELDTLSAYAKANLIPSQSHGMFTYLSCQKYANTTFKPLRQTRTTTQHSSRQYRYIYHGIKT